jgi:hypothetical protein
MTETKQQEEPRKKRAKILSACNECRRKKTKCDGEQPCHNCHKSKSECVYSSNLAIGNEKRNNYASQATIEAIDMRLRAIEDMLRIIIEQSHISSASSTCSSHDHNTNRLPPIQNLYDEYHSSAFSPDTPSISKPIHDHQPIKKRKHY